MLSLLDKVCGISSGLSISYAAGCDLFLQLHYIGKCVGLKQRAVFVSTRFTELHLRIICTKLAIRWDPNLIKVVFLNDLLSSTLCSEDVSCVLLKELSILDPSTIVFDDCNLLERLSTASINLVEMMYGLMDITSKDVLIHVSFYSKSPLYQLLCARADVSVEIEIVGSGFGKEVTGKMSVSSAGDLVPSVTELLYLTGDRSVKCFYPGSASIVI